MGDTSSAMISDCSSLLKRLERSPPASTLLMYSKKPYTKVALDQDDDMSFNLFFDVLVCEEEGGASACNKIVLIFDKPI